MIQSFQRFGIIELTFTYAKTSTILQEVRQAEKAPPTIVDSVLQLAINEVGFGGEIDSTKIAMGRPSSTPFSTHRLFLLFL
jgi:hypothetical protein